MIFLTLLLAFHIIGPIIVYKYQKSKLRFDQRERLFLLISLLLLLALAVLRNPIIGNDTMNYYNFYKEIVPWQFTQNRSELGYVIFNHILKTFFKNPQAIIVATSVVIIIPLYFFLIRRSNYPMLAILLFLVTGTYFGTINVLRQYMALLFLIFAYDFYKEKNLISFFVFVGIAAMFHYSALVFIGLMALELFKDRKKAVKLIVLIGALIIAIPMKLIDLIPYYSSYFNSIFDNSFRPTAILNALVYLIVLILGFYYRGDQEEKNILESVIMLGFFFALLGVRTSIAARMNIYFVPFLIIYFTNTMFMVKSKFERNLIVSVFTVYYTLTYFVFTIVRSDWNYIVPYRFFWQ